MNNQDQINQLSAKLELLLKRQTTFSNDIQKLQEEINHLKFTEKSTSSVKEEIVFSSQSFLIAKKRNKKRSKNGTFFL